MKASLSRLGVFVIVSFLCLPAGFPKNRSTQGNSQTKAAETTAAVRPTDSDAGGKNPVKATPENLAEAKKLFGYDCAMCHGAAGDGKGDLAGSTGMKMNDWRDSAKLEALSDHEIFAIIMKGKGRMVGEADRYPADMVWELVNYVRTFAKKETAAVPKTGSSQ